MRTLLVAMAAAFVALVLAALVGAMSAGAGPPVVGSAHYVVRPDPRECPSPRCGGYWVALANRARTTCSHGALRPRCYVAQAVDELRHPLETGVPDGALVRGLVEEREFGGLGKLGVLVVADVRVPLGQATNAPFYRLRDTGIRCVRAPCFFMRAWRLSTSYRATVSELALPQLTPDQQRRAQVALGSTNGLFLSGRIEPSADGGRRMLAARVYLRP